MRGNRKNEKRKRKNMSYHHEKYGKIKQKVEGVFKSLMSYVIFNIRYR